MPMMMTNRSIPIVYYEQEGENETIFVGSSRDTEQLVAEQAKVIKKDVVGNTVINF